MLPCFIGIGAQRSGTTWIYEMLRSHPEVCMSPEKEVYFFNYHFEKGIEWYKRFFGRCDSAYAIGEISPTYLASESAAQRIKKTIPDVKLLVSLRNPVEQIFSRYNYMVTRQMYRKSFAEALKERPFVIYEAFYYNHLNTYLSYFDRNQILIVIYEDIAIDPLKFVQEVYSFLNVDSNHVPNNIREKIHATRTPRSPHLETAMVTSRKLLRQLRLYGLIEQLKGSGLVEYFKRLNTRTNRSVKRINNNIRLELSNLYMEDKKKLERLLGRDLFFWY